MSIGSGKWIESLRLCEHEEFDALSSVDQIDVACDAFERAWQEGRGPRIEEFIAAAPIDDQTKHRLIEELIPLEFDVLTESRDFSSYLARFPPHGLYLARFFCDEAQQAALGYPLPKCGKYMLLDKVGQGSFGVVYRGYDQKLDRFVAVKLPTGDLSDQGGIHRFLREAKNAGRLSAHPGIVAVHLVGEDERGQPYLVSDFVDGETLQDYLSAPRQLNLRTAASLVAQVAEAVDYAHQHNIIHRDLKPSNIMLEQRKIGDSTADATPDDSLRPRVLDFGLARRQDADASASLHGSVVGTPAYMSPEQARGAADVDHRADVYSLGAILFELVFGERCFPGESFSAVLLQVVGEEPKVPRATTKSIPQDLVTICLKCLNKAPKDRYDSAAELAADLRRWLRQEEITARPRTRLEKAVRWVARNRAMTLAGVAATLLVCTIATMAAYKLRETAYRRIVAVVEDDSLRPMGDWLEQSRRLGISQLDSLAINLLIDDPATPPRLRRRARFLLPDVPIPAEILLEEFTNAPPTEVVFFAKQRAKTSADNSELEEIVSRWRSDDQGLVAGAFLAHADRKSAIWRELGPNLMDALRRRGPDRQAWCRAFHPVARCFISTSRKRVTSEASWLRDVSLSLFENEPDELAWLVPLTERYTEFNDLMVAIGSDHWTEVRKQFESVPVFDPWHKLPKERRAESTKAFKKKTILATACAALNTNALGPLRKLLASDVDPRARTYFIQCAKRRLSVGRLSEILLACDINSREDDDLFYCLALALSQYQVQTLDDRLLAHLLNAFCSHPDSGVHSATRYALCRSGYSGEVYELVDSGRFPFDTQRNWYYTPVGICMIVLRAGTYEIPTFRSGKYVGPTSIELSQTIAIAATELTVGQYDTLHHGRSSGSQQPKRFTQVTSLQDVHDRGDKEASVIDTCRIADMKGNRIRAGCFTVAGGEALIDCDLTRDGHRYPHLAEWQVANAAGAMTPFYFGTTDCSPEGLIHEKKLDEPHPVATFMPNRYGFFDTQGGMMDLTLTPATPEVVAGKWQPPPDGHLVHPKDVTAAMCGNTTFYTVWPSLALSPAPQFIGRNANVDVGAYLGLRFVESLPLFERNDG